MFRRQTSVEYRQDLRTRPPAPQFWGVLDLVPPNIGGLGGLISGYCVSPDRFPKSQAQHHWFFKRQCQNPHLGILGSLVFCVGLTLSQPAGSAPSVGAAAVSVSKIDQRVSTVVTTASTNSKAIQSPAGELPQAVREEATLDHDAQQGESPPICDTQESRSLADFSSHVEQSTLDLTPQQSSLQEKGENSKPSQEQERGFPAPLKSQRSLGLGASNSPPREYFQTLYLPVCCEEDPPHAPLAPNPQRGPRVPQRGPHAPPFLRGENQVLVPLFKGDLGGSPGPPRREQE